MGMTILIFIYGDAQYLALALLILAKFSQVDIGTSEPLLLDVLINALTHVSSK